MAFRTELRCLSPYAGASYIEYATQKAVDHVYDSMVVFPWWVKKVRRDLAGNALRLCSTVGHPWGHQRTEVKLREAEVALRDGATELEVTLNLMALRDQQAGWVKPELARLSQGLHDREAFMTVALDHKQMTSEEIELALALCVATGVDRVTTFQAFTTAEEVTAWLHSLRQQAGEALDLKLNVTPRLFEQRASLLVADSTITFCLDDATDATDHR
ncbi:deoxyribose-phosphate aldolase [Catalinimonas alkaloidigena]|uniref:Deoxyribose-phosphate aldolase n=1 Tax=Catalinimonas alkaloidigena TaxID=1075417 RepID=A0A1G9EWQ0_9BACT|nr:hypothetical protein [Catalinimonas alkaloidigena]SDK80530.1 deoxyribose-phosphate aldolase [Catalinimonas alkaloidigena]